MYHELDLSRCSNNINLIAVIMRRARYRGTTVKQQQQVGGSGNVAGTCLPNRA